MFSLLVVNMGVISNLNTLVNDLPDPIRHEWVKFRYQTLEPIKELSPPNAPHMKDWFHELEPSCEFNETIGKYVLEP
ncbi:MAG: hypothetical protein F4219_05740 [Gammaproteobacteria bacterium]|nr:hypothetical protein [Gammaproteobacteria bacterium]